MRAGRVCRRVAGEGAEDEPSALPALKNPLNLILNELDD
jgi:hypothetical protein